ncbi:hypothetical protein GTP10_14580 [Lactiplantibacillus plantarum]|uniref:hypothetical protein n=1 Tax=Lactiplantibacillus plantarum TaxID=1590 RepID=UPI0003507949|nr:hypothetical protein [Lactiplantibacillus plantarum]AGO06754.1 hypothetical protein Lp16_0040 [Lactiplantibacillus plantarum 16]MBO2717273.1 hypothetical protein [Lactiplantibacillus plantarum]
MDTVSQEHLIQKSINLIDEYYKNNPSEKATIWQDESSQHDIYELRHDRLLKLYNRRTQSMEANLADGDIPFPSANYFVSAKNSQYKIPAIIAPGMSQLLTFEYIKPGKNTYPIFTTFCVDNLNTLYARTAQSVDQTSFLRLNLEVLIGGCTKHHLMVEPQDLMSATEASTYDKLLNQYPLQRNRFLTRLSAYYYMSLLFPVKAIRIFKDKYGQISDILKDNFPTDYNAFIGSKAISISASDFIYNETNIALNEDAYLHVTANKETHEEAEKASEEDKEEPQDYLIQILDSITFE